MRSYYRCSICHRKVTFKIKGNESKPEIRCPGAPAVLLDKKYVYRCVDTNWFERTYLSLRAIIRALRRTFSEK